ncbi:BTB/POZ protein [Gongronella butleri]|nr:BTB/POZ protein [Gongronella butleri]
MTATGASFFDSYIPTKETAPPFAQQFSQESNSSSTSGLFDQTHDSYSTDTPIPNDRLKTQYSVYDEFLPEWQMLSESYRKQKQNLHEHILHQLTRLHSLEDQFDKMSADFHRRVEDSYNYITDGLVDWQNKLEKEKKSLDTEKETMRHLRKSQDEKIKLNVGGQIFETSMTTLQRDPNSTLAAMFNGRHDLVQDDEDGSYFIDRDGTYFRLVLNYLRDLRIPPSIRNDPKIMDELKQEAEFYHITGLLKLSMADDTTKLFP